MNEFLGKEIPRKHFHFILNYFGGWVCGVIYFIFNFRELLVPNIKDDF